MQGGNLPLPTLNGSQRTPRTVLSDVQFRHLLQRLPLQCRLSSEWRLLYSNLQHGISLQTLYRNVQHHPHVILVIMTSLGEVFGAYLPDPIEMHGKHYYGSGYTMLWTFALPPTSPSPGPASTSSVIGSLSMEPQEVATLRTYVLREPRSSPCLVCRRRGLGMGGADMDFCGLWLDASLLFGVTRHSILFGSHPLFPPPDACDSSIFSPVEFGISAVEVWHIPAEPQPDQHELHSPEHSILNEADRQQFIRRLPERLWYSRRWTLLYSSVDSGSNLTILYQKCRGHHDVLLAAMDVDGHVCGLYTPEPLNHGLTNGVPGMMLWTFSAFAGAGAACVPRSPQPDCLRMQAFVGSPTLDSPPYCVSCGNSGMGFGGDGPEHAALWIDHSLAHGFTARNLKPFNSAHLIPEMWERTTEENGEVAETGSLAFMIAELEVWQLPKAPFIAAYGAALPQLVGSGRPILRPAHLRQLVPLIPQRCRLARQWTLVFSTSTHGITCEGIQLLYRCVANAANLMLVVTTTEGHIFGAFVPRLVSLYSPSASLFRLPFASPETEVTVLWTFALPSSPGPLAPLRACRPSVDVSFDRNTPEDSNSTALAVNLCNAYYWRSDSNNYFVVSQSDGFGVGGGGSGDFGIWIDGGLLDGTTGMCETFASPPLVPGTKDDDLECISQTKRFGIYSIEVWCVPDLV
eukprot:GGOE01018552.1.p1 GENE.GGOE01018552.1~~GGOE01018552.1.p1  ORF type:complete len:705 (+),score=143.18 GGOE01018552.1:54-2117(+)